MTIQRNWLSTPSSEFNRTCKKTLGQHMSRTNSTTPASCRSSGGIKCQRRPLLSLKLKVVPSGYCRSRRKSTTLASCRSSSPRSSGRASGARRRRCSLCRVPSSGRPGIRCAFLPFNTPTPLTGDVSGAFWRCCVLQWPSSCSMRCPNIGQGDRPMTVMVLS